MALVKQSDVAEAAGVNAATVSRALCGKGRMSAETRNRIKKIAEDMGYRPDHAARVLAMGRSTLVGVVADASVMQTFHDYISPIQRHLSSSGYSMSFFVPTEACGGERACLSQLIEHRVAGAIVIPGLDPLGPTVYDQLLKAGIKLVIMYIGVHGVPVPQIILDDYSIFHMLTKHLIDLGHEDIVLLATPERMQQGRMRISAFKDAMAEAGLEVSPEAIVETELSIEHGAQMMDRVLKRKRIPTAVIARHDLVAVGAMKAIYAAGLSIPDDISLIGHGNMWSSDMLRVPLTTTLSPLDTLVSVAVHRLLDMCAGKNVEPQKLSLGAEIIVRESTGPCKKK